MNTRLNHGQATDVIKNLNTPYFSADFYRMQQDPEEGFAFALRDKPDQILRDVLYHGSDEALALFKYAADCGYVVVVEPNTIHSHYDIKDIEDVAGAPYFFMSHIAMQIAFPDRYFEHFGGEHVWNYSDPRMRELLTLCIDCMSQTNRPSDWKGNHEAVSTAPKVGRPKKVAAEPKETNSGHSKWVEACKQHNDNMKTLWSAFLSICSERAQVREQVEQWKANELALANQRITEVTGIADKELSQWVEKVKAAQADHLEAKRQRKPVRKDFV